MTRGPSCKLRSAGERYVAFTSPGRTAFLRPDAFTMPTGDIDIRVKLAMNDWTPGTQTVLAARYGGAGSRGFFFAIGATGTIDFNWTTDGTTNIQKVSSATGFTDGTAGWVRVTIDVDNGLGGYTWTAYTSSDGDTWTQVGVSASVTGGATSIYVPTTTNWELGGRGGNGSMLVGKIYEYQIRDGINGKIVNPQPIDLWIPNPTSGSNIIPTYGGSPTLYVLNGSRSGADLDYLSDATRMPLMTRPAGGLVFLSCSHNDTDRVGPSLTATWDAWLTALKARLPGAAFALCTQNPEISPRTADLIRPHAQRRRDLMTWAARNDVYCIDTYGAFQADSRGLATLTNADGIHPVAAGSQLWAETVERAFRSGL
jgi:lysophospholipase L1-like esterase